MIGFRNILVHSYSSLDLDRVYEILLHNLLDIEKILIEFEIYEEKLKKET
ncbi:MAG: hypothetical protein RBG13Loki_1679 [Promethearchaeota archaeon CR_4]|nr:MAG: hypothetical protein RBG13Loki_1679 [Candidatus Lokiarchaeota archaeon CR_4]